MKSYTAPMRRSVRLFFYAAVVVTAAVAAWCFRAGFMWSGIFLVVVAGPFAVLYWYMISVNPSRTEIQLLDEGVRVKAPPFVDAALPYADIIQVWEADLSDPELSFKSHRRAMKFGGYRSGVFEMEDGTEAVVVSCGSKVVCASTADRLFVFGPADPAGLASDLASRMG